MPISRLQMPRQMYGLGSFVKSIGKGIKKIVKSPIGKAAILGFGANALMPGGLSSLFSGSSLPGMFGKAKSFIGGLSGIEKGLGAFALGSAFDGMEDQQIEELKGNPKALREYLEQYYDNLNLPKVDTNDANAMEAYATKKEDFLKRNMQANGGRMGYAEGGGETGGGIESRLEQLGGDVSSAEQMLQEINQRLQTAESGLGGGGAMQQPIGGSQMPPGGFPVSGVLGAIPGPGIGGTLSGPAGNQNSFDQMSPAEKVKLVQSRMMQQDIKPPEVQSFFSEIMRTQGKTDKLYPTSNSLLRPLGGLGGGDNNGFSFRQEGDMGRYIADNDPGGLMAGYSSYQDYLGAGNDPVSRPQGGLQLLQSASGAINKPVGSPIQQSVAMANGGRMGYANGPPDPTYTGNNKEDLPRGLQIDTTTSNPMPKEKSLKENFDFVKETKGGVSPSTTMYMLKKYMDEALEKGQITKKQHIEMLMPFFGKFSEGITRDYERYEQSMANGGRINRAYGSDELVEQASGIEGLDININPKGVKELDLRDSGGFIPPVGVKEKADDIPAMLSNNEFVFTADAVRAAGGGSVNKGAQIMYDTMKKLENGGTV